MSAYRHQAHLDVPLTQVWALLATPTRYPEWWPRVIEVRGERFEEGDEWVQVTEGPTGKAESVFLLERREDLHSIRMSCQLTGYYADWLLTSAQGGTFVELEMGIQPERVGDRLFDMTLGRSYLRRWSKDSLAALQDVCQGPTPAGGAGSPA